MKIKLIAGNYRATGGQIPRERENVSNLLKGPGNIHNSIMYSVVTACVELNLTKMQIRSTF